MLLNYYLDKLDYSNMPEFLYKYLECPTLIRLKKVGYFCGMDYASKEIYNFSEYISRFDHSLSVALLTYKLSQDKVATLAGLFHDIATPCFSHVIDYMNEDYETQESTEEYTEHILKKDDYLKECLKQDNIDISDIINFKKHSIVDNDRPKLCADRMDGVILTGIGWSKEITKEDIDFILNDICVKNNEFNEKEISFKSFKIANKVVNISNNIDRLCHSKEDNYMMQLLAKITKLAIDESYISYNDLYKYNEDELFNLFKQHTKLLPLINEFETIKLCDVPNIELSNVKIRDLNPIVNGERIK